MIGVVLKISLCFYFPPVDLPINYIYSVQKIKSPFYTKKIEFYFISYANDTRSARYYKYLCDYYEDYRYEINLCLASPKNSPISFQMAKKLFGTTAWYLPPELVKVWEIKSLPVLVEIQKDTTLLYYGLPWGF